MNTPEVDYFLPQPGRSTNKRGEEPDAKSYFFDCRGIGGKSEVILLVRE